MKLNIHFRNTFTSLINKTWTAIKVKRVVSDLRIKLKVKPQHDLT